MTGHYLNHHVAWRLALANLHHDDHARRLIADGLGDCPACWRAIAEHFLDWFTDSMVLTDGWDRAVAFTEHAIQSSLDAAARDRGEPTP